jgi:hypothetical protein
MTFLLNQLLFEFSGFAAQKRDELSSRTPCRRPVELELREAALVALLTYLLRDAASGHKPVLGAEILEILLRLAGPWLSLRETTDQLRVVQVTGKIATRVSIVPRELDK